MKRLCTLLVFASLLVATACSDDNPVRSSVNAVPDDGPFYPLAVGNSWEYFHTRTVRYATLDGSEFRPTQYSEATSVRKLLGTESRGGSQYVVEQETFTVTGSDPLELWRRYRQDEAGLFRANVAVNLPPEDAEDEAVEVIRLRYPLEVGNQWSLIEGNVGSTASIEDLETITVPAGTFDAYRILDHTVSMGPDDYARYWYGKNGLLRVDKYTEFTATDVTSGTTITVTIEEKQDLTAISLSN